MKMLIVTLLSTSLSALVISNAYMEKKQFYPTVVYLLTSNRSLGVIYLQGFVMVWFLCKFMKNMFFGTLRAAEVEHLIESSWYAILETFILLAAFHQDLSVGFVAMVTVLFVSKSFHWLAQDRVDFMERSPIITWLFHIRAVSLFSLLLLVDYLFIKHAWATLNSRGFSVEIVFGLEYAIMFLSALSSALHYLLHTIDRQSEDPWENKPIYMRIINIILGFFELALYVGYMAFMLYVLFIPLHIARRVYVTAKNFQKSIYDVIASRQAIRHLNTLYPDATIEELESVNNVCVICREEMVSRCKKLPCGHIFHTACLQSWFQRQQICPTCRMDVLNRTIVNRLVQGQAQNVRPQQQQQQQAPPRPQPQQQQQQPFNPQQNNGFLPPMMFPPPMMPPMWPPHQPHPPQPQAAAQPDGDPPPQREGQAQEANSSGAGASHPPAAAVQPPNPFPMGFPGPFPPFPPPMGFMPPNFGTGPLTGDALQALSPEQLQQLEGMERANVEARIALLRDVQKLLDSAVLRLNQYSTVMAVISPPAGPGFPGYPFPPFNSPTTATATTAATSSTDTVSQESNSASSQQSGTSSDPPRGLFQSPIAASSSSTGRGSIESSGGGSHSKGEAAKLEASGGSVEQKPPCSSGDEELVLNKSKSGSHVDAEVRQRRLDRLHSMPSTSQQSLSPLVERTEEERGARFRVGQSEEKDSELD